MVEHEWGWWCMSWQRAINRIWVDVENVRIGGNVECGGVEDYSKNSAIGRGWRWCYEWQCITGRWGKKDQYIDKREMIVIITIFISKVTFILTSSIYYCTIFVHNISLIFLIILRHLQKKSCIHTKIFLSNNIINK